MISRHMGRTWLGLTVALAVLISGGMNNTRAADLRHYISPDFCAAVVVHPKRIKDSTLAAAVNAGRPAGAQKADPTEAALAVLRKQKDLPPGMDIEKLAKLLADKPVHRVVALFDPFPTASVKVGVGVIVQFDADVAGDDIISAISSQWLPATIDGTEYKKLKNSSPDKPDIAALAPDARTLIVGVEVTVKKMLAKEQGDQPLLRQLQHSSLDNDIIVEFLAAPALAKWTKATGKSVDEALAGLGNPAIIALAKDFKSASIKLNFSGKTLAHAEIVSGKPESASMIAQMALLGVGAGKAKFADLKKNPPPLPPPLVAAIFKLGDEVFAGLTIKAEGATLLADLPMPDSLPDALKLAAGMAGALAAH